MSQTEDIFSQSFLGKLSGKDAFFLELAIRKNLSPRLNVFSELKNVEFNSDFSFLSKKKSLILIKNKFMIDLKNNIKKKILELKLLD